MDPIRTTINPHHTGLECRNVGYDQGRRQWEPGEPRGSRTFMKRHVTTKCLQN